MCCNYRLACHDIVTLSIEGTISKWRLTLRPGARPDGRHRKLCAFCNVDESIDQNDSRFAESFARKQCSSWCALYEPHRLFTSFLCYLAFGSYRHAQRGVDMHYSFVDALGLGEASAPLIA